MKNKKFLASVLCVMMLFSNNGVSVLAETQTTASEFTINSEMLGGLVVTIPDEVTLSKKGDNFVGTGRVTAQGATDPINILRVYTHGTITYKNQYKTDITVDADVDFGDVFRTDFGVNCKAEWDAYELKDNMTAREKSGYDVTVTAPFSDIKYIGEYKTNIVFNIELSQSDTFSLGYRVTNSTRVNTSDDNEDINYAILSQTNAVAVLDSVSFSKRDLKRRGYDYIVEYPLSRDAEYRHDDLETTLDDVRYLSIPSQIYDEYDEPLDVYGVSLDELFKEEEIANLIWEVTLPETVFSIDAYNFSEYCDRDIICPTYREFVSFNNTEDIDNNRNKLQFRDLDFLWVDVRGYPEVAGGGDYNKLVKTFGEDAAVHYDTDSSKNHTKHPELCRNRTVKFKLPTRNNSTGSLVEGVRFQTGNLFLAYLMCYTEASPTKGMYRLESDTNNMFPKQIWIVPRTYQYYYGFQQGIGGGDVINLKGVIFQDGYSGMIASNAFQNCIALDEVVIPASTSEIQVYAFGVPSGGGKWAEIENLYIDYDGTTTVGGTLNGCITNIYFSGSKEEWEASPYYGKVSSDNIYYNTKYDK